MANCSCPVSASKPKLAGGAESAAHEAAIAQSHAKLLEFAGGLRGGRSRGRALALTLARSCGGGRGLRNLQEGVAAADGEWPHVVVDQQRAGVDAAQLKVVVEIPFGVGAAAGGDAHARHERAKDAVVR